MAAAICTLIIDTVASGYYNRIQNDEVVQQGIKADEEDGAGHLQVHTHATHGHAHGMGSSAHGDVEDLIRRRVISQVTA